ncbi:hypothetical protein HanIR_Chr04g0188041 [Helianthus annuus]|nr:hypothetical protein HanIR_Chr04g0188041 [Helianthus annuus]
MGRGFRRGWAENAQATTPGGHGFGRGPFFVGLKPGVGRSGQADMAGSNWTNQRSRWASR